jgi:hypothetical protein
VQGEGHTLKSSFIGAGCGRVLIKVMSLRNREDMGGVFLELTRTPILTPPLTKSQCRNAIGPSFTVHE